MGWQLTVVFGTGREYELIVPDADVADLSKSQARHWLEQEFENLECTPSNPMGKVLVLDMILNVAKYGGEHHFEQQDDWSRRFARAVAVALDRPAIRIDVGNFVVG